MEKHQLYIILFMIKNNIKIWYNVNKFHYSKLGGMHSQLKTGSSKANCIYNLFMSTGGFYERSEFPYIGWKYVATTNYVIIKVTMIPYFGKIAVEI